MTLHEAIDALIDAIESGNTIVVERAVAEARAAQEAYPPDEVEDIVPEDLADEGVPETDAPAADAPAADAPAADAPAADAPANLDG